ncbi:MAG: PQQ-dependent sugar dehydrogenase [Candidatus Diapherotrites archaeon]|uniref:PQQ-dependent sugar dehydrogenase n=1 Tax=Candidatus Iainarchaeum sp. TaxID=3101447 RepID=A0A8T3YJU1_9ARCH|nr:PQQ-dependent sugar dehydrogenase [Candidatus Diapherotrites archaeon]
MYKNALAIFILVAVSGCSIPFEPDSPKSEDSPQNHGIVVERIAENLEIPWAIGFLPDGRMIFTERPGRVKVLENGSAHEIKGVVHLGESGLQGIAVDPEFAENGYIYLYYTYTENSALLNRISRFALKNDSLENETTLLEGIPGNVYHDGGRLGFGPDGKLYASTGDSGNPESSQDKNSLAGKMLRLNKDGSMPGDNPFGNYVYSYGHRNPQGFDWHPQSGTLVSTEHGPSKNDEVNIIEKGANYGWPEKLCGEANTEKGFSEAIVCFGEWTMAPSGAAFYSGGKQQLKNAFVYAGLRGEQIRAAYIEGGKLVKDEKLLDGYGRIRDIQEGPDGRLYFATNNTDGRGNPKKGDDGIYAITAK